MKKILMILVFTLTIGVQAQVDYYINVVQDVKLAVMTDNYGNKAYTPDIVLELELQDTKRHNYYFSAMILGEYANLAGGTYYRYGFGLQTTFMGFDKRMEIGISPNFSNIYRFERNNLAFGTDLNLKWQITDRVKFLSKVQGLWRTDLDNRYGGTNIRYSWMFGLAVRIYRGN